MDNKIYCELEMCIYNEDRECVLRDITINQTGICEDCILPTFPEEVIKKYKKETFNKLEEI